MYKQQNSRRSRLRTYSLWRDRQWKASRSEVGVASLRSKTGPLPLPLLTSKQENDGSTSAGSLLSGVSLTGNFDLRKCLRNVLQSQTLPVQSFPTTLHSAFKGLEDSISPQGIPAVFSLPLCLPGISPQ